MKLLLSTVALFALFNVITGHAGHNHGDGKQVNIPTKQLNDGNHIPTLGLGTYGFDDIPKMRQAINWAIESGYRHIDTAALYDNEAEIGKGISDVLKKGLIRREDLFITTKLWNDKHAKNQVVPALRESLAKLGLQYVDLFLIHSPEASKEDGSPADIDYLETWQGMEEAKKLGLAKSIGVSNFNTEQIDRIKAHSKIVPAVNQIEVHPSNTQEKTIKDCFERNIAVVAYSPFGFFVSRGGGPSKDDPKIKNIAQKYGKSINQVLLRYLLDRDLIPIPKSTNQNRIKENINVFDFHLTPEEVRVIQRNRMLDDSVLDRLRTEMSSHAITSSSQTVVPMTVPPSNHFANPADEESTDVVTQVITAHAVHKHGNVERQEAVPTKQLNDGNHIPILGLGTYGFDDIPKIRQAINVAIESGYRHIDTAAYYANEAEIGKGISDVVKKGLVRREDLYVTTKLWNNKHAKNQVVPALRESLAKLDLQYVDLYLIHSPSASNEDGSPANIDYLQTWQGMEEAKELGLAKSIGLSNFNIEQIDRIRANSSVVPAINQIEVHPSMTQETLVKDCFEHNITVVAYSPFGFFVSRGKGPSKDDTKIINIALKYGKSVSQVLLRYLLDRDLIPIPKSTNENRIKENIKVFDFHLTPEEVSIISSYNTNTSLW